MKRKEVSPLFMFYVFSGMVFLLLYSIAEFFQYPATYGRRILNSFFLVSYLTTGSYFFFETRKHLLKGLHKYLHALVFMLLAIIFYTFGLYGWRELWIEMGFYQNYAPKLPLLKGVALHAQFSLAYLIFLVVTRNIFNNIRLREKNNQLLIEKKEAELRFLKAQTNPHFLFNTLNNIYSLARDRDERAPESILRLSKILRFMLYETSGRLVGVDDEIKVMADYIALEKLRYDDSLQINVKTQIEDPAQKLPPLLLIPLVENAFKHGISETRIAPFVDVELVVDREQLVFVVKNSVGDDNAVREPKENIGLSNLRRQLALLYHDYELSVGQAESVFTSSLRIRLTSHV